MPVRVDALREANLRRSYGFVLVPRHGDAGLREAEILGARRSRTRLVGRARELDAIRGLLERQDVRLLMLSGVGGIGKTRLALAAAERVRGGFADGVRFADLSSVRARRRRLSSRCSPALRR